MLKTKAVENVLYSCNSQSKDGQVAKALMEEVRRSKSSMTKITVFPNGNTAGYIDKSGGNYTQGTEQKGLMRAASSDVQLSA